MVSPGQANDMVFSSSMQAVGKLWQRWKRVAQAIAGVQARVVMMVFYFVVLCPFALVLRWTKDPLAIKAGAPRGWRPRPADEGAPMERARKQF